MESFDMNDPKDKQLLATMKTANFLLKVVSAETKTYVPIPQQDDLFLPEEEDKNE